MSGMHQVGKGVKLAYQVLNGCSKSSTAQCTKRKPVVLVQGLSGVKEVHPADKGGFALNDTECVCSVPST